MFFKKRPKKMRAGGYRSIPMPSYDLALAYQAYGRPAMMGDLFGDIMGAVVGKENWDARPEWMKKIAVKPDPAKLAQSAVKLVPPSQVGKVVGVAEKAGFNLFYNTPAGQVPITAQTAESLYGNFPAFARMQSGLSEIPTWVYLAGGVGVLLLVLTARK